MKTIQIPEGYEFDRIENGQVLLKEVKPKFPESWRDLEVDVRWVKEQENQAYRALLKLIQLKNEYRRIEGGTIDWEDDVQPKFSIVFYENDISKEIFLHFSFFLAFLTQEARDHFLEHHKELIEQAKPLLVGN